MKNDFSFFTRPFTQYEQTSSGSSAVSRTAGFLDEQLRRHNDVLRLCLFLDHVKQKIYRFLRHLLHRLPDRRKLRDVIIPFLDPVETDNGNIQRDPFASFHYRAADTEGQNVRNTEERGDLGMRRKKAAGGLVSVRPGIMLGPVVHFVDKFFPVRDPVGFQRLPVSPETELSHRRDMECICYDGNIPVPLLDQVIYGFPGCFHIIDRDIGDQIIVIRVLVNITDRTEDVRNAQLLQGFSVMGEIPAQENDPLKASFPDEGI